ncbi:MAG TPA: 4-(cytidine 5'-diphospho)-2-C-methyl-D-erythritol kinase [Candidatus Angelobacter sp.]|jgi:4-diphosphocytidyl-2-C-methyl-D-erythritol kinase|nr:4-(cytidine 5'-diphospho)-2-C-methyl-D-erythritol kinase [Candidatus Angelobacter sp.]
MLVVPAYAKVNLSLEVTERRPSGWHDIASVICTIDWHDLVGVSIANSAEPVRLRLSGPHAEGVPTGPDNLAARAAALLLDLANDGQPKGTTALHLWLDKRVPAAAGLGGGSADAAAVLRAGAVLLTAAGRPIASHQIAEAAAELGSDVPAVLAGGSLLATGRGEQLASLTVPPLHLAIAVAGPSATAAAYAALNDAERRPTGRTAALAQALARGAHPPDDLLGSALEPAACRAAPGLGEALDRLRALTPHTPWHLTGSGGAAFTLAPTEEEATRLAATAQAAGFPARACRTVPARLGPLPRHTTNQ